MFDFIFGGKKILGIDIGASALKIVELEMRKDKPYLSNYAWMKIPDITGRNSDSGSGFFETAVPHYLKNMIKEARFGSRKAYLSIPSFGGLVTLISLPKMPLGDLEQAIRFEAHKYIPIPLEEVVTSWEIVKKNNSVERDRKESDDNIEVVLVAAPKNKIASYENIAKNVGFKLSGIEIENLSMVNSLIGSDKGNFLIVDIGHRVCNMICVEGGIIKVNRNIDAGGIDLTKTIAKNLGITEERAEMMKISGENFFSSESSINFPTLDIIFGEISRIIESRRKIDRDFKLDSIILSGGSSNLVGIREFFEKKIKTNVLVGNPFGRIDYDIRLEPVIQKIKSHFSVCIGLALKGMEDVLNKK